MKIGIDFGTTHTVVAMVDRGNYPIVSFEGGEYVPSLIAVRESDGDLRFGYEAAQVGRQEGWRLIRSLKRLLNEAGPLTEITVGPHSFRIADLLTYFLSSLKWDLVHRSNAGSKKRETLEAAVSLPANALSSQRFLTIDSFKRAGFEVAAVLNEPSAAGFEYANRFSKTLTSKREYVVIYDLGGGTFDASLIRMSEKYHEVITSVGVAKLGGDDFDEAIADLVSARAAIGDLGEEQRILLVDECRRRKETLESNTKRFMVDLSMAGHEPLVLPAEDVYEACRHLVERSMRAMEPMLMELDGEVQGGISWNEVASIYAVGGVSNFPLVYRSLRERFGANRVRRSLHPFAATAVGLAIFLDETTGYKLKERFTRNFGVWRESHSGQGIWFDVIFPKDTRLPGGGEPPLEVVRRYSVAHNIGHFRFVECNSVKDGTPGGAIMPWGEITFPFLPSCRDVADRDSVPVVRLTGNGPNVEERYSCNSQGMIEVKLTVLDDGYSWTFKIDRPRR